MHDLIFNFQAAERQAASLEETASKLKKMANQEYGQTLEMLSLQWQGESADAFLSKSRLLQENLKITANDLERIANNIRAQARRIYEAEMEAKRIAETILTGGQ